MIDPKRRQQLLERRQKNWLERWYDWQWVGGSSRYPEIDKVKTDNGSRGHTQQGQRLRVITQILAGLNFIFLMLAVIEFFIFTKDDGTLLYDVMNVTGTISKWMYLITAILMLAAFGLARSAYEFQSAKYQEEADHVITQTWVLVSGVICMFLSVIQFVIHVAK